MNEKLLKQIIRESINKVLNEEVTPGTYWNMPYGLSSDKMIKIISQKENIEPLDLKIDGNKIIYMPSKKRKSTRMTSPKRKKNKQTRRYGF